MSAVLTPGPAISLLNSNVTTYAPNVSTSYITTATALHDRAMPPRKRLGRSLQSTNNYTLFKVGGRTNGPLTVWPDGNINITSNRASNSYSIYAYLQLQLLLPYIPFFSKGRFTKTSHYNIRFKGKQSKSYICMDSAGTLYSSKTCTEDCDFKVFNQRGDYQAFCSAIHSRTKKKTGKKIRPCIGFYRNGKPKPGYKVKMGKQSKGGWFFVQNISPPKGKNFEIPAIDKLLNVPKTRQNGIRHGRKKKNRKRVSSKSNKPTTVPVVVSTTTSRPGGLFASVDNGNKHHKSSKKWNGLRYSKRKRNKNRKQKGSRRPRKRKTIFTDTI